MLFFVCCVVFLLFVLCSVVVLSVCVSFFGLVIIGFGFCDVSGLGWLVGYVVDEVILCCLLCESGVGLINLIGLVIIIFKDLCKDCLWVFIDKDNIIIVVCCE